MMNGSHIGVENPRISADDALIDLRGRVQQAAAKGERPVIVYDLDATLFDNRPRVMQIVADLLLTPEAAAFPVEVRRAVGSISPRSMKYRLSDTLRDHGVEDEAAIEWFQNGWFEKFFTNEYVQFDLPTQGAVEFVKRLHEAGAVTLYLTGRDTPGMRDGTLAALKNHKFPMPDGDRVYLITKPTFEQSDMEYKQEVVEDVKKLGTVVGVLDNEPKPMNVLAEAFPDAAHIFLDTMHSPDIEPLLPGIRVMTDFRLS